VFLLRIFDHHCDTKARAFPGLFLEGLIRYCYDSAELRGVKLTTKGQRGHRQGAIRQNRCPRRIW